jgi:hypothetical protein
VRFALPQYLRRKEEKGNKKGRKSMIRFTARTAAAGLFALGITLAAGLANALPASAATSGSTHVAASVVTARTDSSSPASAQAVRLSTNGPIASPDIEEESCTSSRATWVHAYTDSGTFCLGYAGLIEWSVPPEIYTFCAGNNYGYYELYYEPTGKYSVVHFTQGFGLDYPNLTLLVYVEIDGWSGSDKC